MPLNTLSKKETILQAKKWQISSHLPVIDIDFGQAYITKCEGVNKPPHLLETKTTALSPRDYQETGHGERLCWFRMSVLDL